MAMTVQGDGASGAQLLASIRVCRVGAAMPEVIEIAAGEVAAELERRGVAPDQQVKVLIEPDDAMARARRVARPKVIADGLSDDDIDALIKQAQQDVEPLLPK